MRLAIPATNVTMANGGTLHEDALGNINVSGTGTTWRRDALGNFKGSDSTP